MSVFIDKDVDRFASNRMKGRKNAASNLIAMHLSSTNIALHGTCYNQRKNLLI